MASPSCAIKLAALSSIIMMVSAANAMQYTVGGAAGWVVGEDLQTWADQYTFYVGDALYFEYIYGQSSVLLVTEEDYKNCNTNNGVASDGGLGDMVMTLLTAETYYFISGHADQCTEGLRLQISVLAVLTPGSSGGGGIQPALTNPPASPDNTNNIPSSPVILSPPRSINTPYSTFRPNSSSPSSLTTTSTFFSLALVLAFSYLLTP